MSVTVDEKPLAVEEMGFRNVGQVLHHVQKDDRLVVNLLIDGVEPDLASMGVVRQSSLADHVIYIETAEPRQVALDVLEAVELQLDEVDRLKNEAVDLLQRNSPEKAMEK